MKTKHFFLGGSIAVPLIFAGCIGTDPQPAFNDVGATVSGRTGQQVVWARDAAAEQSVAQRVHELLGQELTVESATAIALLNNRSLQAAFEEIGVSQADLSQASRLSNPELAAKWRFPSGPPSATNTEYSIAMNFLELLTLPARKKIAAKELEAVKLRVANQVLNLAYDAAVAFYTVQARQQLNARLATIEEVNRVAANLAQRQYEAGNIPALNLHQYQAQYSQSSIALAQARAQLLTEREQFNRCLSLWGNQTQWKIADDLPPLPETEPSMEHLESLAVTQRLDLAAAEIELQSIRGASALKESTRWLPGLTLGVQTERETDGQRITGPTLSLELPIFDQGQPALARLSAQHRQAMRRYEALAINIRSQVREARDAVAVARDVAQFYEKTLLPQRQQILRETLLQYNAMQLSNYELLAAKQSQQEAERAFLETLRDYWLARAELQRAVGGDLATGETSDETASPAAPSGHDAHAH